MHLPSAYYVADRASGDGQGRARQLVALELVLIVAAGGIGILTWRIGGGRLDAPTGVAVIAFLGALLLGLHRSRSRPEERWYRGRAAAESMKSLAWLYAVGGDPFPLSDRTGAEAGLVSRTRELLSALDDVELTSTDPLGERPTAEMRTLRAASLPDRKETYQRERITDQVLWYTQRARRFRVAATWWMWAIAAANVFGIVGGLARFLGVVTLDLLSLGATLAGAAIAWTQFRQYETVIAAYSVAAAELGLVRDLLSGVEEEVIWAAAVGDAERAISREHTTWLARRGMLPRA